MQLHKLFLCGLFCSILIFSSCTKENDETWYFYDQTMCADAWDVYVNIDFVSYEASIEYHFSTTTDVIIDEIQILDDGAVEQSCEACICTTGTRIRVRAGLQYQETMEAEGFMLE